jgi:hypothetical protein
VLLLRDAARAVPPLWREARTGALGAGQAHLVSPTGARRLSWKETAQAFHTSWEKVFHAVEYTVQWGLQARSLDSVRAIGVDEIQYGRGHQYLTLVYGIQRCPTLSQARKATIASQQARK